MKQNSKKYNEKINNKSNSKQVAQKEISAIRKALLIGEKSGFSEKNIDDIWDETRKSREVLSFHGQL